MKQARISKTNRMALLLYTRKGLVFGFAPVSWLASKDSGPNDATGLPGNFQWPIAISSLTVARQRGTFTRFPPRQRRRGCANQNCERTNNGWRNLILGESNVKRAGL